MHRIHLLCTLSVLAGVSGCLFAEETVVLPDEEDLEDVVENADVRFEMHAIRLVPESKTYVAVSPPPTKRSLFRVHAVGGELLVLGGLDEDGRYVSTLEAYDPAADTWQERAPWPEAGFAWQLVVGERLCTVGGYQSLEDPIRTAVDCYHPATDTWVRGPEVPEAYSWFVPVAHGGKVYVLGGIDDELELMRSAWSFDPQTNVWTELAALPSGRAFMGVQPVGGKIYLTGGFSEATFSTAKEKEPQDRDMLAYDPALDAWSLEPQMPHSRALYALDEVGGKLAVTFGITDGPLVELFDPATGQWTAGTDPPALPTFGVYSYAKHADAMHLLAVADQASPTALSSTGTTWRYDPVSDAWGIVATRDPEEPNALFLGQSVGGELFFVGARTILEL